MSLDATYTSDVAPLSHGEVHTCGEEEEKGGELHYRETLVEGGVLVGFSFLLAREG